MLEIKTISLRNFLSVGQVTQTIHLNGGDLTLILGENMDLGGNGARNGVGKTALIQAISYALFGSPINNIKRDNLINRTNAKDLLVTLDFSVRGVDYRIIRGRKPNILKFYVNNEEREIVDDAQGDSRETGEEIQKLIGMSQDMFCHIVALNTYNEPFLGLKAADQRTIIEQLLGITLLSEKAESVKVLVKKTKDEIKSEEFKLQGQKDANQRIQEQIDGLKRRQTLWTNKKQSDLDTLAQEYTRLSEIDIVSELDAHQKLVEFESKLELKKSRDSLLLKQTTWKNTHSQKLAELESTFKKLNNIDIVAELEAHSALVKYNEAVKESEEHKRSVTRLKSDIDRETKNWSKLDTEVSSLKKHRCYACGQSVHDTSHSTLLDTKVGDLAASGKLLDEYHEALAKLENSPVFVPSKPVIHYKTHAEAIKHNSELENLATQIANKIAETDPYAEQLQNIPAIELGEKPTTHYKTVEEARKHQNSMTLIEKAIESKFAETDPYVEQIADMEQNGIKPVSYDTLNEMNRIVKHQEYLIDLLTNKKSFVRKTIIEQSLKFLNSRLDHYLKMIGLPHEVRFQNDLSVEITELGRDLDFYNLSRGEMNRVVLALSFAFRDVFENLYNPVNILMVDELIDSGMDTIGVENCLILLKDLTRTRSKSFWLVSHSEDLATRVNKTLKVIKSNGFTTYEME
jgi:DNA repair exonuclease SbcCD ATPase subunit